MRTSQHGHEDTAMTGLPRRGSVSASRRSLLAAAGAATLAALVGACATPLPPLRPVDRTRAPRVGDTWRYGYRSEWRNVPPRTLDVAVISVTDQGIGDRLTVDGAQSPWAEQLFTSQLAIVARALSGVLVHEFSPYLEAFGPLPAAGVVTVPPPAWGTTWSVTAQVRGTEQVNVPAGSFAATRVDIFGSRFFVQMDDAADPVRIYATAWFAAAVKRFVRFSYLTEAFRLNPLTRDHIELLSYRIG
jgi:hypothetical protein